MGYYPRCGWRRRLKDRTRNRVLRKCLILVLILECTIGTAQLFWHRFGGLSLIRMEESGDREWFIPGEGEREGLLDVFGIQFRLEEGEVRIYRSRQEIKSH